MTDSIPEAEGPDELYAVRIDPAIRTNLRRMTKASERRAKNSS